MTSSGFDEEVVRTDTGLVGILARPETPADRSLPWVVIPNAGNLHRVGAGRASVTLARRLAAGGYAAFRFDHAGVGDSPPRRDGADVSAGRVSELQQVLSDLESRYGASRFVVFGLCTGARDAFHAAVEDERIVGIVQIDGFAYRNTRFHMTRFLRRLRHPLASIHGLARRLLPAPRPVSESEGENLWVEEWSGYPPRAKVEEGYRTLVARGVQLFVAFTGSWGEEYNYHRQFVDMYRGVDFSESLTLRFMPDASHTLVDPFDQRALLAEVVEWLGTVAPAQRGAAP